MQWLSLFPGIVYQYVLKNNMPLPLAQAKGVPASRSSSATLSSEGRRTSGVPVWDPSADHNDESILGDQLE